MCQIIVKTLLAIFVLSMGSIAYAIDAPKNFTALENNNGQAKLQWDEVPEALFYSISYGNQSYDTGNYTNNTDFIEDNSIVIPQVKIGETTYFSIVSIDSNGDASDFSKEIEIILGDGEDDFVLDSTKIISSTQVDLVFSQPLETKTGAIREFSIYTKISKEPITVLSVTVDSDTPRLASAYLAFPLQEEIEYEVAVIAIVNAEGKSIISGIDSLYNFNYIPENIINEPVAAIETIVEEKIILESAPESNNGGINISQTEVDQKLSHVVDKNKKLPQTGPEVLLLFILTLILSGLLCVFKYKKN